MAFDDIFLNCKVCGEQTCFSVTDYDHHQVMEMSYHQSTMPGLTTSVFIDGFILFSHFHFETEGLHFQPVQITEVNNGMLGRYISLLLGERVWAAGPIDQNSQ